MNAFEFVSRYSTFVDIISDVVKPELAPVVNAMREIDSHDLVGPESWFPHSSHALGFVWALFYKTAQEMGLYNPEN